MALLLMVAVSFFATAEEDPYLSALSKEAQKVEVEGQTTQSESDEAAVSEDGNLDLQMFEEDLKARYKGSYTFYQKLPRRTREEVFVEYRDGASIDEIRKKIMDRFLHQ
ncbi:MAG: hypothetical protein P8045_02660 [Candidatus Thiodiazotropha sp.]